MNNKWYTADNIVMNKIPLANPKYGKGKGKLLPKIKEISGEKAHTETYLKYFDGHRCLSRSEESKCMWTCGKMASRECLWKVPLGGCETGSGEGWGVGDYLRLLPGLCQDDRMNSEMRNMYFCLF